MILWTYRAIQTATPTTSPASAVALTWPPTAICQALELGVISARLMANLTLKDKRTCANAGERHNEACAVVPAGVGGTDIRRNDNPAVEKLIVASRVRFSRRVQVVLARALCAILWPWYGTCLRCGMPWKFTSGHTTNYRAGDGCFPLCEDCWSRLTPAERLPYYMQLIEMWRSDTTFPGERDAHNGQPWPEVIANLEANVMAGK